jgi:hypothetical protein
METKQVANPGAEPAAGPGATEVEQRGSAEGEPTEGDGGFALAVAYWSRFWFGDTGGWSRAGQTAPCTKGSTKTATIQAPLSTRTTAAAPSFGRSFRRLRDALTAG